MYREDILCTGLLSLRGGIGSQIFLKVLAVASRNTRPAWYPSGRGFTDGGHFNYFARMTCLDHSDLGREVSGALGG